MNSTERHEARYQRRRQQRLQKKQQRMAAADNYDAVFTFDNLYRSYKKCCQGVGWKASTQRYKVNAIANVNDTLRLLKENKYKGRGFYAFDIVERGKARHIKSVHISERVVQRCLCDYSLVPMLSRSFIYDNGACMAHKGVDFAADRLACHLQRHYRKYGTDGYALIFDFSKYFDTIAHEPLKRIVDSVYTDKRITGLVQRLIDDFGDIGLGLGSQISQVCALRYPNKLDHYVKEVLRIKGYGRYMDDGYLLRPDKKYLQKCLSEVRRICAELGIALNPKKTQIVKISNGITFLKRRFILTCTGKVIRKPARKGITKMRRKLRTFKRWLDAGKMAFDDIKTSFISFKGHLTHCNAYGITTRLNALFYKLFYGGTNSDDSGNYCAYCVGGVGVGRVDDALYFSIGTPPTTT